MRPMKTFSSRPKNGSDGSSQRLTQVLPFFLRPVRKEEPLTICSEPDGYLSIAEMKAGARAFSISKSFFS